MKVLKTRTAKPNIKNIAEAAGVSLATVSRVINSTAKVSENKAQNVYRAASLLGYQLPRRAAASMQFRTRNIALVFTGWSGMQLAEWGFMEGMDEFFSKRDVRLVLTKLSSDGQVPSLLSDHACDGVIALGDLAGVPDSLLGIVGSFPCVQIVRGGRLQAFSDEVLSDNASIAQIAIDYLGGLNVRKFAFLNIHPEHDSCVDRGNHFEFILRQRGVVAEMFTFTREEAESCPSHQLVEVLVDRFVACDQRPDGLFIPVDFQLPEVYAALRSRGIEPMRDVQIVSCDNCDRHLMRVSPRPATIDQLMSDLGYQAARQLAWRIQNPTAAAVQIFIKPKLVPPAGF
jgi:LacI family transcriptional regulator